MKRLAILITHPIQYYAPVFRLLHERKILEIRVFYTWGEDSMVKFDPGFGQTIAWDIPLLQGYPYEWVKNTSKDKGSHHFRGIVNPDLMTRVQLWQPDALLIYGWANQSHLKAIHYFKHKLPIFFRGDSTLLKQPAGIKKYLKYLFLRWVYEQIDHAFFVGANNKAYFKKFGLKNDQLTFAPHAVDNDRFCKSRTTEVAALRKSLAIADDEVLILYAGKLNPGKNVALLLEAFLTLNAPATHLLLVGNGISEAALKLRAEESGASAYIHFMDFQNQTEMPVVYQAADLLCLPSVEETWGLGVNEAMACSTAVLASDCVGCAIDLIEEGYNGAIFKSGSLPSITEQLKTLVALKRSGLKEFGLHSKIIIDQWTFRKQVSAIEATVTRYDMNHLLY